MRYKIDVLCIALCITCLTLKCVATMSGFNLYLGVLLLCFLQLAVVSIKHNHIHLPIFENRRSNRLFDYILTLSTGFTTSSIRVIHSINHHVHNDSSLDWGSTHSVANKGSAVALLTYVVKTPLRFIREKKKWFATNEGHRLRSENLSENIALIAFLLGLAIVGSPVHFVAFVVFPMILSQVVLMSLNFFQHYHCKPNATYRSARNFTGWVFNHLFFNVGYHTAHHLRPTLHWSQLKSYHEAVEEKIPSDLCEENFLTFLYHLLLSPTYENV